MDNNIQIPNCDHVQLEGQALYHERRMAGVAQQMTDGTFDFVAKPRRKSQAMLIKKLAHGRVSRTKDGDVQLWLKVSPEENINISQAVAEEAQAAAEAIQQYQLRK